MTTLNEIARLLKGTLKGDSEFQIKSVRSLLKAGKDEIAVSFKEFKNTDRLNSGALVVKRGSSISYPNLIYVDDPHISLALLIRYFFPDLPVKNGNPDLITISQDAKIGKDVIIGDFCRISENVTIKNGTVIDPGVIIYPGVTIGSNCKIYSNVVIRENSIIGSNVIIQPGAVIGSDGFGFARDSKGIPVKIPQKGRVVIGDNCEIGANVCIDRSTLDETVIGSNVKIDNLVQIGHNVKVGDCTTISAQSGISGSTKVGENVIMAGQVGLADHIKIGNNVIIAAKSGVSGNIENDRIVAGIPHNDMMKWKKNSVIFRNLEKYIERIKIMEKKIENLEEK